MATNQIEETLKTFNKPIDAILKLPRGPKRWRAAHDMLWLNLSWKNRKIYQEVCEDNRIAREAVDKFGFAKGAVNVATGKGTSDHTIRQHLSIPTGAYYTILKSDPEVFSKESNAPKFFKTFPEYTTRELY